MTDLTPEKRAELRAECDREIAQAKRFRSYLPTTVVETFTLAALLDALDAKDAELIGFRGIAESIWEQGARAGLDAENPYRRPR